MSTNKLVQRLKTESLYSDKPTHEVIEMGKQAASMITKLEADLETAMAELDQYKQRYVATVKELETVRLYAELYRDIANRYAKTFDKIRPVGEDNGD